MDVPECLELDVLCVKMPGDRCAGTWQYACKGKFNLLALLSERSRKKTTMDTSISYTQRLNQASRVYAASQKPSLQHRNCVGLQGVSKDSTRYISSAVSSALSETFATLLVVGHS